MVAQFIKGETEIRLGLLRLRFRPTETLGTDGLAIVAIFAGHVIDINNPVVGTTGTFTAFPPVGGKEFLVF